VLRSAAQDGSRTFSVKDQPFERLYNVKADKGHKKTCALQDHRYSTIPILILLVFHFLEIGIHDIVVRLLAARCGFLRPRSRAFLLRPALLS
jgi:hypothetical protein